jgi:LmbE family N-acetylglucosaminyl deacetylase
MLTLGLDQRNPPITTVLCLGAHSDDIEVGCSGTVLKLLDVERPPSVTWVVFSGAGQRRREAFESADAILARAKSRDVRVHEFRDSFFPTQLAEIKERFEELKAAVTPDLVLTHFGGDFHQDHRVIAELTWNTFRNHLILEYEIPKYDGDFGAPGVFVHLDEAIVRRKIENLMMRFPTQAGKPWFTEDLFRAVLRLRGMESNAPERYAEAFYCRKLVLS